MAVSLLLASFFQPTPVTETNTFRFSLIAHSALIRLSFCQAAMSPIPAASIGSNVGTDELEPSVPTDRDGSRSIGCDSPDVALETIALAGGKAVGSPLPAA